MKRCPQCNRVETDDALAFCRADGTPLVSDSSSLGGEAGKARLSSAPIASEIETSILPHTTDAAMSRASTLGNLAYALPLALTVFCIAKIIPRLDIDLHFVMVVISSLLLWSAGAYALFTVFPAGGGSCVIDFSGEEISQAPPVPFDTAFTGGVGLQHGRFRPCNVTAR